MQSNVWPIQVNGCPASNGATSINLFGDMLPLIAYITHINMQVFYPSAEFSVGTFETGRYQR